MDLDSDFFYADPDPKLDFYLMWIWNRLLPLTRIRIRIQILAFK
jgi:hypothetical protein